MRKRGAKPKGKVKIKWSPNFAYAIGLLATDGCLSKTKRHIIFVSKDLEQAENFLKALDITDIKIGKTFSGYNKSLAYRIQFGDVLFYRFLNSIGLFKAKSKTIGELEVPVKFFFDFLRGCFDGDGTIYSYWDKRWRSSFMFYISFATASHKFMSWLRNSIYQRINVVGHVKKDGKGSTYQLTYAKSDSLKILRKMFKDKKALSLTRKKLKIKKILTIVDKRL